MGMVGAKICCSSEATGGGESNAVEGGGVCGRGAIGGVRVVRELKAMNERAAEMKKAARGSQEARLCFAFEEFEATFRGDF